MFARKRHCFSEDSAAVAHPITIAIAHSHLARRFFQITNDQCLLLRPLAHRPQPLAFFSVPQPLAFFPTNQSQS